MTTAANGLATTTNGLHGDAPRAAVALYAREQIDTIKQTVAKGATDSQLALFLEVCRSRGLDPFTRQVHWTPNGVIVGIDGFRAIADRTGRYVPGPTTYETDPKSSALVAAHVTVRKNVGGQWFDLTESAYLAEYAAPTPIWKAKPRVMLAKCAEARALRRAFPAELSGLYAPEEMDAAEPRDVNPAPPRAATSAPQMQSRFARAPERAAVVVAPAPVAQPEPAAVEAVVVEASEGGADDAPAPIESVAFRAAFDAIVGAQTLAALNVAHKKIEATERSGKFMPGEAAQLGEIFKVAEARLSKAGA